MRPEPIKLILMLSILRYIVKLIWIYDSVINSNIKIFRMIFFFLIKCLKAIQIKLIIKMSKHNSNKLNLKTKKREMSWFINLYLWLKLCLNTISNNLDNFLNKNYKSPKQASFFLRSPVYCFKVHIIWFSDYWAHNFLILHFQIELLYCYFLVSSFKTLN